MFRCNGRVCRHSINVSMKKSVCYLFLFLIISLGVSLFFNYKQYRDAKAIPEEKVDTKTETKVETKVDSFINPTPVSVKIGNKISVKKHNQKQKSELISQNDIDSDSIPEINPDGDIVETDSTFEIPITQKRYEDSCYVAYVSGYHASLDSIYIRSKIITNNITTTLTRKKKWTIGLQGGFYLTPKGVQPGIGLGFAYNL